MDFGLFKVCFLGHVNDPGAKVEAVLFIWRVVIPSKVKHKDSDGFMLIKNYILYRSISYIYYHKPSTLLELGFKSKQRHIILTNKYKSIGTFLNSVA